MSKTSTSGVEPRGPLSQLIEELLGGAAEDCSAGGALKTAADEAVADSGSILYDEDVQAALLMLYALHYGDLGSARPDWEWHIALLEARSVLERALENELRTKISVPAYPTPDKDLIAAKLFELTAEDSGPSVAKFLARGASLEQAKEFLMHKSVYTLKEADPHSWAIPRLQGRSKAALVEIQADEYGGGDPKRVHATIFARTLRGVGLSDRYGFYVDAVPAITLAGFNTMSMFGLNRRLRGAIVGHLAAFEMTSSIPNRFYGNAFRRLGFDEQTTWYFDEHVEADAVHEQIAARDLAGSLAEDTPELIPDIFFGAQACLLVDSLAGQHQLEAWEAGRSSLRGAVPAESLEVANV